MLFQWYSGQVRKIQLEEMVFLEILKEDVLGFPCHCHQHLHLRLHKASLLLQPGTNSHKITKVDQSARAHKKNPSHKSILPQHLKSLFGFPGLLLAGKECPI